MLAGNDNVGIDATPENEPGNQMAGFDIRWNSPIGNWPYAIYAQYIGEDESSYLPAKYLAQLGLEIWKPLADGGLVQGFVEYATTTCSANTDRGPYYNCAYNQGRFNVEGYRYKGRVIGYTSDRDAENYALGGTFAAADGALWTATARTSRLNRDDFGDVRNTVASVPTDYDALEFGWSGRLFGEQLRRRSRRRSDRARGRRTRCRAVRIHRLAPRIRAVSFARAGSLLRACSRGVAATARADPWLAPGDEGLRSDIQLLADAGILRGPVTTWPHVLARYRARRAGAPDMRTSMRRTAAALVRVRRLARVASSRGFAGIGHSRRRRLRTDDAARLRRHAARRGRTRAARELAHRSLRAQPAGSGGRRSGRRQGLARRRLATSA